MSTTAMTGKFLLNLNIALIMVICSPELRSQSFATENLSHLYSSSNTALVNTKIVKGPADISVYYEIRLQSGSPTPERFLLSWDKRGSYSDSRGTILRQDSIQLATGQVNRGKISVTADVDPWLLVLTVSQLGGAGSWVYPMLIEKNYPVNGYLSNEGNVMMEHYLPIGKKYSIESTNSVSQLHVFLYDRDFQSPQPPFSTASGPADPLLLPDSSFTVNNHQEIAFSKEGLYLVQADTNSAEGFSFRVQKEVFPRYTRIDDLSQPMVYVSTKDEFSALQARGNDKLVFDKTVLGITKDKDRARKFMKSYFNRVEWANRFFTSFKEGWKTDRGMIFVIFGPPDEVRLTGQNEIWYYKNTRSKFVFVRRGSIYDPEYYVLMRDDKYSGLWYNTIDLWRKSRF